jgi:hypothetical protein
MAEIIGQGEVDVIGTVLYTGSLSSVSFTKFYN